MRREAMKNEKRCVEQKTMARVQKKEKENPEEINKKKREDKERVRSKLNLRERKE